MKNLTKLNQDGKLSKKVKFMIEKESLKINFGGEDCIRIDTLRDSLDATLKTLEIIANKTLKKEDYCKFVVENVQIGCFEIIISVIKDILPELVLAGVTAMPEIVKTYIEIIKLRKSLKGHPPIKIEDNNGRKEITNRDGNVIIIENSTFNIYVNNDEIEKGLAKMNRTISQDGGRTTLEIKSYDQNGNSNEDVDYSEEEIKQSSNAIDVDKLIDDIEIQEFKCSASIKRPCFSGDTKWDVKISLLDNKSVSVSVEDAEFLEKIQKGEIGLSATTRIFAQFESKARIGKNGESNGSTKYSLKKVFEIHQLPKFEQVSLDSLDDDNV